MIESKRVTDGQERRPTRPSVGGFHGGDWEMVAVMLSADAVL